MPTTESTRYAAAQAAATAAQNQLTAATAATPDADGYQTADPATEYPLSNAHVSYAGMAPTSVGRVQRSPYLNYLQLRAAQLTAALNALPTG
jgi:hypothetical protein